MMLDIRILMLNINTVLGYKYRKLYKYCNKAYNYEHNTHKLMHRIFIFLLHYNNDYSILYLYVIIFVDYHK